MNDPAYENSTAGSTMLCPLVQDVLPLYLEGEVSDESAEMLRAHLDQCEICAAFLAGVQKAQVQLQQSRLELSDVLDRDRSAQRTLTFGRRLTIAITLSISAVALITGTALWAGMNETNRLISLMTALAAVAGSTIFIHLRRTPLFSRWLLTITAAFAGVLGIFRAIETNAADPVFQVLGMLVGFIAIILVWIALTEQSH